MTAMTWLRLLSAALALTSAACAPTAPPIVPEAAPPTPAVPDEVLPLPQPAPSGPQHRILAAIEHVRQRELRTDNGFWTVFHGILGLGPNLTLRRPGTGERVNALDFVCAGEEQRGERELEGIDFFPTKYGLDVRTVSGSGKAQGHQDQFIAEMAQWNIPADRKFTVHGQERPFLDFVKNSQKRARVTANQELSWTIVVVGQYLGTDCKWTNAAGEKLRFEDLVRYELKASIENAACGGTHRLFGLTWVLHLHRQRGGKQTGVWQEVADHAVKYRDLARKYRNPDGSFSTEFFRGPGNAPSPELRINTTGHTLEWLALALPAAELKKQWVEDAANALALMILDLRDEPIPGGALYHAVHGLLLYHARVYGAEALGRSQPYLVLPPPEAQSAGR